MADFAGQGALAGLCLAAVLILILGAGRLARRLPAARTGQGPIRLVASLPLDRTHRLHVVEVGGRRSLVLTGGPGAIAPLADGP